ncbi:MAG: hypothetical protein KC589_04535 [Nanoarchaeota archaeon]|nr:hypothetical protein [Nanoarchaeota archaeon]
MSKKVSKKKVSENMLKNSKIDKSKKKKSLDNSKKDIDVDLIVSEKEILEEEKLDKKKGDKISKKKIEDDEDSQPSWYHYVIIFIVLGGIFAIFYYGFEFYSGVSEDKNESNLLIDLYNYPYVVGKNTYNIKFHYPIDELDKADYPIEVNKYDMLNTLNITRVFLEYNGTDNGKVIIAASKLYSFFNKVFHVSFAESQSINSTSCVNSTINAKVMVFDVYANKTGVFYNKENGCIEILAEKPEDLVLVSDKFIYEMIKE